MRRTVPGLLCALALSLPFSSAEETPGAAAPKDTWLKEAELPKGFPPPGPYDQVVMKSYPAYRAARTETKGPNTGFWTLFGHIKKNGIAMTAPVEMTMSENEGGNLGMSQMAFLYEDPGLGKPGADGGRVEVVDLPALRVLSIAWRGPRSTEKVAEARRQLLAEAAKRGVKGTAFRVLGYNSPSVPGRDRTHELQLILE